MKKPRRRREDERGEQLQREADEEARLRRLAEAGDLMWGDEGIDDPPESNAA